MRLRRNLISTPMVTSSADPSPLDILPWLKTLPLAPEYHPTVAEFQDPIAYILKIEKEASAYGICKIVPPIPAPSRKTAITNLNRSFSARNGGGSKKAAATFSSRQQQIGFCPRKSRPAQKPVWQSGEQYTLQEFEAKAKQFEKSQMKRCGRKANNVAFSPLEVETLFWKASADKPIMVEYANDMPGSGFAPLLLNNGSKKWREEDICNVGDTAWNMRGVSRAKGSLLKFMKEEIPGVTSPMMYVGTMFSWFAWHMEDHELHSLNYMHIGAGKTWYGVPRDAAFAFEEVVRVHGYGGEVNPLVTFAILGEKTTVMSPEVLIRAGIPCCRLVQNAGDFVVTFPGTYHCGFSHGFNCGEAANIATPEWLKVAKEAAIRRASINYPPMLSHFQLLYELALSLSSRIPLNYVNEPRSSRLKDKMKGEGEIIVKELFVENISRNNNLLHILLGMCASCVVLPQNALVSSFRTDSNGLSRIKCKTRLPLGFCSHNEVLKTSSDCPSEDGMLESNMLHKKTKSTCNKGNPVSICHQNNRLVKCNKVQTANLEILDATLNIEETDSLKESSLYNEGLLNQGLLSCVACGILSFACVAIIQPTDAAALHLMSSDCSSFDKNSFRPRFSSVFQNNVDGNASTCEMTPDSGLKYAEALDLSYYDRTQVSSRLVDLLPESVVQKCPSALDLLASAYRNSDSEEDSQDEESVCNENEPSLSRINAEKEAAVSFNDPSSGFLSTTYKDASGLSSNIRETSVNTSSTQPNKVAKDEEKNEFGKLKGHAGVKLPGEITFDELDGGSLVTEKADFCQKDRKKDSHQFESSDHVVPDACKPDVSSGGNTVVMVQGNNLGNSLLNSSRSFMHSQDRDSSRMHVFCLEHACEVENQLRLMGGAHMMVLCHPGYPHLEAEAKLVAEELGSDYVWKDVLFKDATEEDHKRIKSALEDEEVVPSNSDWAVKMHLNLYYSSNLSKSPLYSKQLPYNAVIYKAFGRNSFGSSPKALKVFQRRRRKQKKVVVAGRWCGKVWMSNQVHPYLACKNETEEEHREAFQLELADQEMVEGDIDNSDQGAQNRSSFDNSNTAEKVPTGGKRKKSLSKSKAKKVKYDEPEKDTEVSPESSSRKGGRVLRERVNHPSTPQHSDDEMIGRGKLSSDDDVVEMPSTRLRRKSTKSDILKKKRVNLEKQQIKKKGKEASTKNLAATDDEGFEYLCDLEGCTMSFSAKQDLALHKRNICPVKGCGKKFFSHKYLVQHRRVHLDDRPLKCPWKGCKMSFKWAWARTEHIRVHTGDRPYICMERGCGQTFRFVSDFSRHKRKTGHVSKKGRR